mgnify:CR=1 FL=1
MAYKFQLGAARLSGSIIQTDGDGDLRATVVDSLASGIVDASGLASLDGGINVNDDFTVDVDGNVVAVAVAVGDNGTIGNASRADMLTLAAAAVTVKNDADFNVAKAGGLQLAGAAVTSTAAELNLLDDITRGSIVYGQGVGNTSARLAVGGANTVLKSDGTDISYGAVVNADIGNSAAIALSKLAAGGSAGDMILAGADPGKAPAYVAMSGDATIASGGGLTIADNAVSLAKMANLARGSIIIGDSSGDPSALVKGDASTFLQSDGTDTAYVAMSGDATLNAGAITLAAAQTNVQSITNAALILSGNAGNKLDLSNAAAAKFVIGGADKMLVNATGVTIDGNLSVLGTTTTINSTTINISKSFTFEGDVAGDNKKTILDSGLPIANTDIKLPTLGAGTYHLPVLADAPTAASALVTAAEFALLDGATAAQSVTIVDADRIILNDDGTMKQVAMSDVKTYAEEAANALTVAIVADGAGLVADKVQYVADRDGGGQSVALTLPASAAGLIGKSIYLKAGNLENGAVVTVATQAGDQKIDGADSIILESPYASVRLIYVVEDQWRVF